MAINAGLGVQIPAAASASSSSGSGIANNLHNGDDHDHYDAAGYAKAEAAEAPAGSLDFARRLLHSPPTSPTPRRVPLEHRSRSDSARSDLSGSYEDGYLDYNPVASTSSPNGAGSNARRRPARTKSGNIPSKSSEERRALRRLVAMYEQLSAQLDATLERETDLETNLKIARSNLALAENHAEQLEDTIKRNSIAISRLSSSSTGGGTSPNPGHTGGGLPRTARGSPNLPSLATVPQNQQLHTGESDAEQAPSPRLGSFWRRRPTVGAASNPNLAQLAAGGGENGRVSSRNRKRVSYEDGSESEDPQSAVSILRKPSFGVLRSSSANTAPPPVTERERMQATQIASLQSSLQTLQESYNSLDSEHTSLKSSYEMIANKYSSLQEEIENLSVSLFEEANTMVAEERKVNTFLNEQLDKAKEEVDLLQKELEELRAFKASQEGGNQQQRRMSPEQALLNNYRMPRKGSVASSIDSGHYRRSRRRSSVAAIDLLESVVAAHSPTTRRASRDMAAAAAAVRALTQRDEEDNMPSLGNHTPRRTSYQLHLQQKAESSAEGNVSFPRSASPLSRSTSLSVSQTRERQSSLTRSQAEPNTIPIEAEETSAVEAEEEADSPSQPIPARQRWFSFGSRKRPKPESLLPNVPPPSSHGLNGETSPLSPIPPSPATSSVATMSPALPPRPPSSTADSAQQQQQHHGHTKSLSVASALDAIRPSTSNSSLATLAGNRPLNKANLEVASSAPMQTSISVPSGSSSSPLEVPPTYARSASSLSQRERFFSQASPSVVTTEVELPLPVSTSKSSLSASADASLVLSPASRELDDLLQDMEQDNIASRYFGLADKAASQLDAPDPASQQEDDAQAGGTPLQRSSSFRDASDSIDPSPQLNGVRRKNAPTRIDTSLPAIRTSGLRPPTPSSAGTSPFPMPTPPPFKRFPSSNSFRSPLHSPNYASGEPTPLPFSDSTNNRSTTPTGLKGPSLSKSGLPKLSTSGIPSTSSLHRSDTMGSATSFKSLNAFMDSSNARGIERQNSGLSGSGSLVEDLDSLLKSIDAIHESLGLEEE